MQDDKELRELLMKWGVEQPASNFTSRVMQQVTSTHTAPAQTPSLLAQKLPRILIGLFILVCFALIVLSFLHPVALPAIQFNIQLPSGYIIQGFYFLIAFWTVLLLHIGIKKYSIRL